jgi:hypothetical protein
MVLPKRVNTQGFACPNQQCPYSGITEAHIHALVGDGTLGHAIGINLRKDRKKHPTPEVIDYRTEIEV